MASGYAVFVHGLRRIWRAIVHADFGTVGLSSSRMSRSPASCADRGQFSLNVRPRRQPEHPSHAAARIRFLNGLFRRRLLAIPSLTVTARPARITGAVSVPSCRPCGRQIVRIDRRAVAAHQPGANGRKFHFVPAAFSTSSVSMPIWKIRASSYQPRC